MAEQLAIMKDVSVGHRDAPFVCMWFSVFVSESSAALTVLPLDDPKDTRAIDLLATVYELKNLEGRPVWVDVSGNVIQYLRPWRK